MISCSVITLIIVAGITLGVFFGIRDSKSGTTNVALSNDTINTSTAGVVQQLGSDPSQFSKDAKLKQSFYGIAYTMMDALYPDCNEGLPSVIEDMQILSQLTTRIRL